MIKKLLLSLGLFFCVSSSFAIEPFVISDVQVKGNGRLDDGTIFNYLPLKVGDEVNDVEARLSIKALFETGFFRNVKLKKDGTVLVVEVEERPSIAGISLEGNKDIKSDQINEMLNSAELSKGRILNQRRLNEVVKALSDEYFARGRYSAEIKQDISLLDQNRARIILTINEGRVATIKAVNFVGNEAFSDKTLLKQMKLTSKRGLGFSRRDLYSKQKLEGDLEALRSFYTDKGYFEFDIRSSNVTISQNKQSIDVFINVSEGALYQLGEINIQAADTLGLDSQALIGKLKPNSVFSRKAISDIRKSISDALADKGYGTATVSPVPNVNESNKVIDVRFDIDTGARLYVRRINVVGNIVTQDTVIRREMRQLEGARFSAKDVRRSQERLQRLGYFEEVRINTVPVPGVLDQVDLLVLVKERASTGSINFALGYADVEGVIYQLGYNQRNFLGTGKEVAFKLDNSSVTDLYEIRYTNPYYTQNGVSRSLYLDATAVDSANADTAEYFLDSIELGMTYRIPISEANSVGLTLFAEQVKLEKSEETPPELLDFIDQNPDTLGLGLRASISKDTLDDFIFPTSGSLSSISLDAAVPGSEVEYYKVNILGSKYFKLSRSGFSLKSKIKLGFGGSYGSGSNAELPFYKNYYAGGPNSVRGFKTSSLGPLDTGETPTTLGGSRRLLAGIELLSPKFGSAGSKDKRVGAFVDAGMVYAEGDDVDTSALRYSAGIFLQWYSVLGPLGLSYGVPLNEEDADKLQKFQISLGRVFR